MKLTIFNNTFSQVDTTKYNHDAIHNTIGSYVSGPTRSQNEVTQKLDLSPVDSVVYTPYRLVGFKRLLQKGNATTKMDAYLCRRLLLNPYLYERELDYYSHIGFFWYRTQSKEIFKGFPYNVGEFLPETTAPEYDVVTDLDIAPLKRHRRECLEDFSAKLTEDASFQCGVFLAELEKTKRMLYNPASALFRESTKLGNDFKRLGRFIRSDRKRLTNLASRLYLEAQYGWRPLMADIDDALLLMVRGISKQEERLVHSRRTSSPVSLPTVTDVKSNGYSGSYRTVRRLKVRETVKYSAAIKVEQQDELTSLMRSLGVLPYQLPAVAWELTPFSFVIDYFAKINNLLSYKPDLRSRIRFNSRTYFTQHEINMIVSPNDAGPFGTVNVGAGSFYCESEWRHRQIDEELGDFLIPHLRTPKTSQILNLTALVAALTL